MKDSSIFEVFNFNISIESTFDLESLTIRCKDIDLLVDLKLSTLHRNGELFMTSESKGVSTLSRIEFTWENTHANQIASMDSFIRLGNYTLDSQKIRTFGSPVSTGTTAILFACQYNSGMIVLFVELTSLEETHSFVLRNV